MYVARTWATIFHAEKDLENGGAFQLVDVERPSAWLAESAVVGEDDGDAA